MGAFFFALTALLAIELLLWSSLFLKEDSQLQLVRRDFSRELRTRIYSHWLDTGKSDPFVPPFLVFSNEGSSDTQRLRKIYEATRLPPNRIWQSFDFLRPVEIRGSTKYAIHSNSLGARGTKRLSVQKKNGALRIVALGAYHTFGHGVDDGDAYPAQVEKLLNASSRISPKYEVLNFGRHASTAIVGLAKMKFEVLAYKPDVLLLDYGFVDPLVFSDNFMPTAMLFPDSAGLLPIRKAAQVLLPVLTRSLLVSRWHDWLTDRRYKNNTRQFVDVMRVMINVARENRIPVILIRPFPTRIEPRIYKQFVSRNVGFIDTGEVFAYLPPSPKDITDFLNGAGDWTLGVDSRIREYLLTKDYAPYKINPLQMSPRGHRILAERTAGEIRRILKANSSRQRSNL